MSDTRSVAQVAEYLGVSRMTIHRLIKAGKLPAWRVAGSGPVRIPADAVEALKVPVVPSN